MLKIALIFLGVILIASAAFAQNPEDWSWYPIVNSTNAPPSSFTKASSALVNNTMVIFGGISNGVSASTSTYEIVQNIWNVNLNITTPPARASHGSVVDDLNMIIYGGSDSNGLLINDLWKFDLVSGQWSRLPSADDGPRCSEFGATSGGRQSDARGSGSSGLKQRGWFVFGGRCANVAPHFANASTLSSTLYNINIDTGVSTVVEPEPNTRAPSARAGHTTVMYNNAVLVYGGYSMVNGTLVPMNDLWAYHAGINMWTEYSYANSTTVAPKLYNHIAVIINDNLFVLGGKGLDTETLVGNGNVYQFNLVNKTWTMPVQSEEPTTADLLAPTGVLFSNTTVYTLTSSDVSSLWVLSTLPPAGLEWYYVIAIVGGSVVIITGIIFAIYCVVSRRDGGYNEVDNYN